MTWVDLIADVRAQIDVTDDQAYVWLLDRARIMNSAAQWLVREGTISGTGVLEYRLPADCVKTEAVLIGGLPYKRVTLSEMDAALAASTTGRLYTDGVDQLGTNSIAITPLLADGKTATLRYLADVPNDRSGSPPFPLDIHSALADGAIATGLARMDERFDSAGYFDARFNDATARLRLRRNSHVGRGPVPLRVIT